MAATNKIDPMKYEHTAVVKFFGRFPIDMLRYDHCFPASGEDASRIQESIENPTMGGHPPTSNQVTVRKYSWLKNWNEAFTAARWQSFRCEISPGS
jgi:hypothetical protein